MEEPVTAPPPSEPEPEPSLAPSEPDPLPREPTDASVEPTAQADAGPAEPAAQPDSVPVEPEAKTNAVNPAPDTVPPAPPVERPRKKRKLEEVGFENSTYSKIRTIVRNLRPLFVQVFQNANFRETNLPADILKEIKTILELSKKLRTDLASVTEPPKPSTIPPMKDDPNNTFQGDGSTIPQTNQAENVTNDLKSNEDDVGAELKDVPKNLEDGFKGTYVVGGSPIGWNFLVYPGSKPMYYGRTKAEKKACQIEN